MLNIEIVTAAAGIQTVIEEGREVFPCRCGQTHRGDYAAETWNHHNCRHNEKLMCIGGIGGSEHQAICPECGRVWAFDDAGHNDAMQKRGGGA
jgi:hypothetical protein